MARKGHAMKNGKRRIAALLCCFILANILPAMGTGEAAPNPEEPAEGIVIETEETGGNGPGETGTAEELTAACQFETNGKTKDYSLMTDRDLSTFFPFRETKGVLTVTAPSPIGGVSVMLFDKYGRPLSYDLQAEGQDGEWTTVAQGGTYLAEWHALAEPAGRIRLNATCRERLRIAEIRLFGPGEKPADVQAWTTLEKCDLMLLSAHPDDEILWFAGLLPTYAGERGYRVQLAVLAPTGGMRKLELLSAIWHCGVRAYPELLGFIDKNGKTVEKQYSLWRGKNRVLSRVVEVIRKHQPEVLVTHGEKGEYGHGAHKVAADAAKNAFKMAAQEKKFTDSVKKYGTWQIKKLYLHEYGKNQITCDWTVPLSAFGGKTGYEVAEEAFAFHASQIKRDWDFEIHGKHDNALFGLAETRVGQDTGIGDLMEHIPDPGETDAL